MKILFIVIIIIIKTLFTLGLERKIYRNKMIRKLPTLPTRGPLISWPGYGKISNPKNPKAPTKKRRKLANLLLYLQIKSELTTIAKYKYTKSKQLNIRKG